ncbi:MAG: hypothetical protein H6737_28645 [Alphaproteobacteria bacterium]|nr:hypothetical protein [Alphaproteobacteria bacterium]
MTHASYASLGHPLTGSVLVRPGDLVGRLRTAAMCIPHPSISEAHAYLSLRDGALKLLALRGGLAVEGVLVREVTLTAGLRIALAHDHFVTVDAVTHPERLLALRGPDGEREVLTGRAMSLGPEGLVPRIVAEADVHLWTDGGGWMFRDGDGMPRPLESGEELRPGWVVVEVAASAGMVPETALAGRLDAPLHLECFFDAVHVHRAGREVLTVSGVTARLVAHLAEVGQPVHWSGIAALLWRDERDPDRLRKKWDILLLRFRRRLAEAHVRTNLVHSDGTGNIHLLLGPFDRFVDLS